MKIAAMLSFVGGLLLFARPAEACPSGVEYNECWSGCSDAAMEIYEEEGDGAACAYWEGCMYGCNYD